MSQILYMRISAQNIACLQRQMHTFIHHSVIHYEHTTRERERERETKKQPQVSISDPSGCSRLLFMFTRTPAKPNDMDRMLFFVSYTPSAKFVNAPVTKKEPHVGILDPY